LTHPDEDYLLGPNLNTTETYQCFYNILKQIKKIMIGYIFTDMLPIQRLTAKIIFNARISYYLMTNLERIS